MPVAMPVAYCSYACCVIVTTALPVVSSLLQLCRCLTHDHEHRRDHPEGAGGVAGGVGGAGHGAGDQPAGHCRVPCWEADAGA